MNQKAMVLYPFWLKKINSWHYQDNEENWRFKEMTEKISTAPIRQDQSSLEKPTMRDHSLTFWKITLRPWGIHATSTVTALIVSQQT